MKRPVLKRFVADHPEKAVEVLVKCCLHDPEIEKDITDYLLDQQSSSADNASNNDAHVALPSRKALSQRTGSFSSTPRQPTRTYRGTGAHVEPPSPAPTHSTRSKSLSGGNRTETIIILAKTEDDDMEELPAIMMVAPIEYSVVSEQMFAAGRICDSTLEEIDEVDILVPRRGAPGHLTQIPVSSRAKLTWKRKNASASHRTSFFVVPREFLEADVLLGSQDSRGDMAEIIQSPPPKGWGLNLREHAESYHLSSDAHHGSKASARVQPEDFVQNLARTQREQRAAQSQFASAAAPNQHIDSSRTPHSSAAAPTSSANMANLGSGSDRIRVSCVLGSTALSFWLDLDASAHEFFETLHTEIEKKKKEMDRATTSILFTYDKTSVDDGRDILLSEDELEADWEETVEWIRDHKRQKSPHIYAVIQFHEP